MKTALTFSTLLVFAAYKTWMIGWGRPVELVSSYAVDLFVWGGLWCICMGLERSRLSVLRYGSAALFYPVWLLNLLIQFAHTYFFDSAAERRFSLLDVDLDQAGFFFAHVLPIHGLLTLLGLLFALTLLTVLFLRTLKPVSPTWAWCAFAVQSILTTVVALQVPNIPNPAVDIFVDMRELWLQPAIVINPQVRPAGPLSALDKSGGALPTLDTPFKKIVVIVMETMNEHTLGEQVAALPASTFLRTARMKSHSYARYYTSNQDSRTGMLGMLSSRFIPYEAYTEEGRDHYLHLSKLSSLPELFHGFGYETAFAVSQTDLELVVGDMPWQQILNLSAADVAQAKPKFLCFNPYEFEHSCEDKLLLPRVVNFLVSHERAFVYQEMIWGHASEYNEASGKSNAAYYSEYLDALISALRAHGLLEQTLLVVTADHGFRDKAMQLDPKFYQVPLFFFADHFKSEQQHGLYSHLDFKDLLLHELTPGSAEVSDNAFVFAIGPTGTAIRAVITRERRFLAFKERASSRTLLREEQGKGPARAAAEVPVGAYLKLLDSYRTAFEAAAH